MVHTEVWSNTTDDGKMHVLVLRDGVFAAAEISPGDYRAFVASLEEGVALHELLGDKAPQVPSADVTRAVAKSTGDLILESNGQQAIKLPLKQEGIKVVQALEKIKGRDWVVDIEHQTRWGSGLIAVLITLAMAAGLVWVYFGVVNGQIQRIQWLIALVINTFGAEALLVLAGLIVVGGIFGFVYYLTHPAEVWTLEKE